MVSIKGCGQAGDSLGKTEGQTRGILCGFCLTTTSVIGELLPTVNPTIFFQQSHLVFSLPDMPAGALYFVLGQYGR